MEIIYEITHATGKYLQGSMEPAISKGGFKSTKTILSYSPGHGEFENFCLVAMPLTQCFIPTTIAADKMLEIIHLSRCPDCACNQQLC